MSITHLPITRMVQTCFAGLAAAQEETRYTAAEQALYDRIVNTQDPQQWFDVAGDDNVAQSLWSKMQSLHQQRFQSTELQENLLNLPSTMSEPPGGYI